MRTHIRVGSLFVTAEEFRGRVVDEDYIEGAIELAVNEVPVITRVEWDLVDQLWAYIVTASEDLLATGQGKTSFPDQPIDLVLTHARGTRVEIALRYTGVKRQVVEERNVFLESVVDHGRRFFTELMRIVPNRRTLWEHELRRLERLRVAAGLP